MTALLSKFRNLIVSATVATAALSAGSALAGPQYVDTTGFAVSGYDVVAYRELEQAPVGQSQPEAVLGSTQFTTEYNGATWAFASAENLAKFEADPDAYAPAYDGHCAYGVSKGGKVPGNPNLWRIVDGTLYLNVGNQVVGFWEEDIPGNISIAENKWPALESKTASTRPVPGFDATGPAR
jgi:YHS domain-containing protein